MLTARKLATVLAALRHWQQHVVREGFAFAVGFPHFVDDEPLSIAEIDTLCHRLNKVDARCGSQTA